MKTAIIIMKNIITALTVSLFVAGCSGESGTTNPSTAGAGSIKANLVWGNAKTTAKTVALAPTGVTTVRFVISGSGMTTVQQDFAASAGTGAIGGVLAGSGRTFTAQGLNGSGTVTYQGSANNIIVQPGLTTDIGTITMNPTTAPPAPSGLTTSAVSSSQINLSWTDTTGETGYKIERKTGSGGTYAQIATPASDATSYNDTGLTASTTYFYQIRATNSVVDSGYSGEASATTSASSNGGTGTIQLPKTGQTISYAAGDDGATQRGVAWPSPRFTDNNDGTVTDNLTGLIWLKNANCFGTQDWATALTTANTLANGACSLSDSSIAGQWRLPNRKELNSLLYRSLYSPALPVGHPFSNVQSNGWYWSSSSSAGMTTSAWVVSMYYGAVHNVSKSFNNSYVWPVRAGQ